MRRVVQELLRHGCQPERVNRLARVMERMEAVSAFECELIGKLTAEQSDEAFERFMAKYWGGHEPKELVEAAKAAHAMKVVSETDGSVNLFCSCGWGNDFGECPDVDAIVAAAAKHRQGEL
jgi:hypothetical protein